MDKIQKFLSKLTKKEQDILSELMVSIKNNSLDSIDVKKLVGEDNLYRVRK
jgi:mRNA-degrading endonuclease RelE of RelBE toxin-antitoxin system